MSLPVAVAIGGSILSPSHPDPAYLQHLAKKIHAWAQATPLLLAIGGGHPAREAIQTARAANAAEEDLDRIGIQATRLNAQMLLSVLHANRVDANTAVPTTVDAALELAQKHRVVVMGGTTPGHSTDYVAAELAVASDAKQLVIATSVDGVYTADPNKDPDAQRKEQLTFDELLGIVEEKEWSTAGAPGVIDGPATVLIAKNGVPTRVVHGRDLDALDAAVRGEVGTGTVISGAKVELA